jgi:hypothetical protein
MEVRRSSSIVFTFRETVNLFIASLGRSLFVHRVHLSGSETRWALKALLLSGCFWTLQAMDETWMFHRVSHKV